MEIRDGKTQRKRFKNSSQDATYWYEPGRQVLSVEFRSGTYEYANVSAEDFEKFDRHPFTGRYFVHHFRMSAAHPGVKVAPAVANQPQAQEQSNAHDQRPQG